MNLANLERKGVSVVICCYNSATRLLPTLQHLQKQQAGLEWEIILIDNNSTDDTGRKALEIWEPWQQKVSLRVVKELQPGTMHARLRGMKEAMFRYLLYCDDDNWLNDQYLKTAFEIISVDEGIAAVGGKGILKLENPDLKPAWIEGRENNFGAGPQGKISGDTTFDKGCLYTAGAILDRVWLNRLYNEYGFQSSLKGRDGKSLVAGEDTELTYALKLIGGKLYYSGALTFFHFMPPGRMTWAYLRKLYFSFGRSEFQLSPYYNYFARIEQQSIVKIILIRLWLFFRKWITLLFSGRAEGSEKVLSYERMKGEVMELLFNLRGLIQNQRTVSELLAKNKLKTRP